MQALLAQEQFALHDGMNDRSQAVVSWFHVIENAFHNLAIGERHWGTGCVDDQLLDEVAGKLTLVFEEQLLELADVGEGSAIGELSGWING